MSSLLYVSSTILTDNACRHGGPRNSGASYVITTTLDGRNTDSLHDSVLTLYSTDGTSVLMTNDDYDGLASQISWTAPSAHCFDSSSCIYFLMVSVMFVGNTVRANANIHA